jgi:pantoate--beta-alanine ligase
MQTIRTLPELRKQIAAWRQAGERIAFVPTMGNLHAGHLALIDAARARADRVVVSIFVNPTQFGPGEDFSRYPRTEAEDAAHLETRNTDLVFMPDVDTLYPGGTTGTTFVEVPGISDELCGEFRPGHFRGVATVVARLLNMVQPDVAVFGEKDFQQLVVIRRMVRDLAMPVEIAGVATMREADGLAMSSRNQYLSPEERQLAPLLYRTLRELADALQTGESPQLASERGMQALAAAGFRPDYVTVRSAGDLQAPRQDDDEWVILAAATLGRARLIDNLRIVRHKH